MYIMINTVTIAIAIWHVYIYNMNLLTICYTRSSSQMSENNRTSTQMIKLNIIWLFVGASYYCLWFLFSKVSLEPFTRVHLLRILDIPLMLMMYHA